MNRSAIVLHAAVCLFSLVGCGVLSGKGLPDDFAAAIRDADSIAVISVNPSYVKGGDYHGWRELGRTTITSAAERKEVVRKLNDAIRQSDGTVAACFNPRHAVLANRGGKVYEVIICFECMSLQLLVDGERTGSETITQSQGAFFNKILADASVPIAD